MKESSCHDTKMAAYYQEVRRLEDKFNGLELNHMPRRLNEMVDACKSGIWSRADANGCLRQRPAQALGLLRGVRMRR